MKKVNRALCVLLCAIMLFCLVGCANSDNGLTPVSGIDFSSMPSVSSGVDTETNSSNAAQTNSQNGTSDVSSGVSDTGSKQESVQVPSSSKPIIPDTGSKSIDVWRQMPFVTKAALNMGYTGGEGCQWMTYIAFDRTDGSTAYACVDVGGLLKSTDGGKSWAQSTIGLDTEGSTGVTVDPTNNNRVLVVGGASSQKNKNGLYLSTDKGFSWSPKKLLAVKGNRDFRRQIAFDESSYDAALGGCKVIYWSTENIEGLSGNGVYKSTNGGNTWKLIPNSSTFAGSNIAVHSKTGVLYLSNSTGLYKCTDGTNITKTSFTKSITYLDTSKAAPDKLYITTSDDMYVYDMRSNTATAMNASGYPEYATFLSVSQSNPNVMVLQSDRLSMTGTYNNSNYYSKNGGKTWYKSQNNYSGSFIPYNARQNPSSIHPTNPNIVIKLGGDFIMRSTDGGANYKLSNDGNSAMCIGGKFNFNVNNPDLISVSSQDYNGGFSTDGGKSWTYLNWSGLGWGGNAYGAYMINETTMVAGVASSWSGPRELCVTYNRGETINHTDIIVSGDTIGMGVPGDNNTVFFAEYRSTDAGRSWSIMNGCTAVYTASQDGSKVFGANGNSLVMSTDKGKTWYAVAYLNSNITDVAFIQSQTRHLLLQAEACIR